MRRVLDVVLIALILGAAGLGAYELGHRVDHYSNEQAARDSELTQPVGQAVAAAHSSNRTPYFIAGGIAAAAGAIIVGTLVDQAVRRRHRGRWHAP